MLSALILAAVAFQLNKTPAGAIQVTDKETKPAQVIEPEIIKAGLPVRIHVPRINVDAKIDSMGLTKSGDMDAPVNIANGGWYKHGPNPGNEGSAVIAGHRTGLKGEPGIFSMLGDLQKGDSIMVSDDKGQNITFIVREVRSYDQNEKPAEVFNSNSGVHLNLVTCTGSWNAADRRFSKRLVVFADL